jgi:hypothetical protein
MTGDLRLLSSSSAQIRPGANLLKGTTSLVQAREVPVRGLPPDDQDPDEDGWP